MAICLTICQYLFIEFNYDTFHVNFENTYRIVVDESKPDGESYPYPYETGYAVGVTATAEIPEIKQYARIHKYSGGAVVSNPDRTKIFTEDALSIYFVDKTFFDVFDFPLSNGRKEAVLNDKFNVVITERTAQKYFGTSDVIGKVLSIDGGVSPGSYTVTGILTDLPVNSHLQFDFLLPVENYMQFGWGGAATKNDNGWTSPDFTTYLTLEESANVESVRGKLDELIVKNILQRNSNKKISLHTDLQPIREIHLRSNPNVDQGLVTNSGNLTSAKFFSIIACFILIVAWVNYINLSTAHSIHRSKEVGIRKSIGAFRRQLISQFMIESFTTNMVSAVLALGFFSLFLPMLSELVDKNVQATLLQEPMFWVSSIILVSLGSILSGLFPAFVLSSFKPISMLGASRMDKSKGFNLRRALITFQFLISLFLMAGTYLVYKQITFMKSQEMGMEVEKIVVLKGPEVNLDRSKLEPTLQSFTQDAGNHHSIASVAASSSVPGKGYNTGISVRKLGAPASADKFGRVIFAGFDLPVTYDLEFVAGSTPTREMLSSNEVVVVINEEAVRTFDMGSAQNALNEKLFYKNDTFKVVGVVKNFHWHSLVDAHTPYLFEFYNDCRIYFSFRINLANIQESVAHIQSTYNSFFPGNAFEYFFLEDEFNKQYKSDVQFGQLFFAFSMLAIFIACIGLFALVSYSATMKVKEIGIRKVMGATTSNLMMLLSKEYLILLAIAILIAIPAIFYWGKLWLANYAFKVALDAEVFLLPGFLIALLSLATVSFRTHSAANADPVKSLKTE